MESMKKTLLSLLFTILAIGFVCGQTGTKLEIGKKAPEWKFTDADKKDFTDRKSTRLNSSHLKLSRMPSSA